MTVITKKENLKLELQKEYHSLKNFLKLDSIEEKPAFPIKEHLAENLYNSEISSYSQKDISNYDNFRIKKDLKLEKNRALCILLLHKGLFF